jgi:hypothetical protein
MAPYTALWDETAPQGTEAAADIDLFFQNTKRDIRERIAQVIPGWADDNEDPKRVVAHAGGIGVRPTQGDSHSGEFFYNTTTKELQLNDGTSWDTVATAGDTQPIETGTLSQRPAASASTAGRAFFATDTDVLYVDEGGEWTATGGGGGGASLGNYFVYTSDTISAGPVPITAQAVFSVNDDTDGSGIARVLLSTLPAPFNSAGLIATAVFSPDGIMANDTAVRRVTVTGTDIQLQAYVLSTGADAGSAVTVSGALMLFAL